MNTDPVAFETTEPEVSGELRLLSPRGVRRVLAAVSGWLAVVTLAELTARLLLGYRRRGTLRLTTGALSVRDASHYLGRERSSRETVLVPANLSAARLERGLPRAPFALGTAALCLGTYVGCGFLFSGLTAPGWAPSLLGLGLLIVAAGLLADVALSHPSKRPEDFAQNTVLRLELPSGRGLELAANDPQAAETLMAALHTALAAGEVSPAESAPSVAGT